MLRYDLINERILDVYIECNIKDFPIDCFGILKNYGFRLISYMQAKEFSEELFTLCHNMSSDAFTERNIKAILYNSKVQKSRLRFSLMHELGHLILEHKEESEQAESEADYFASNILAPRPVIEYMQLKNAEEIRDHFDISITAANRVISDFRRWQYLGPTKFDLQLASYIYEPSWMQPKKGELFCFELGGSNVLAITTHNL